MNTIYLGDELSVLKMLKAESIDLVYLRLPEQFDDHDEIDESRLRREVRLGDRVFDNLLDRDLLHLEPRLEQAWRVLAAHGTLYLHSTPRQVHYIKALLLDEIFGRENFVNEIIWATEGNGKQTAPWPIRHNSLLMYAKDLPSRKFNRAAIDRIPYMAPGLVSDEKEQEGKLPTDTWWFTQNITEKEVVKRAVAASSDPGDTVLDFFAGEGLTGEVCRELGRRFILIERDPNQGEVVKSKFEADSETEVIRAGNTGG